MLDSLIVGLLILHHMSVGKFQELAKLHGVADSRFLALEDTKLLHGSLLFPSGFWLYQLLFLGSHSASVFTPACH